MNRYEHQAEFLALAAAIEKAKALPGGVAFVTDLFLLVAATEGLAVIDAKDPHAVQATLRAESIERGRLLLRVRDALTGITLADEGDRVYFGSTNDADAFRDAVATLDAFKWERVLQDGARANVFETCRRVHHTARELVTALRTASHALRSYQHGNTAPALAQEVADHLDTAVAAAVKQVGT